MSPDGYNAKVRMYPFNETVSAQDAPRAKTAPALQDFRAIANSVCFTLGKSGAVCAESIRLERRPGCRPYGKRA